MSLWLCLKKRLAIESPIGSEWKLMNGDTMKIMMEDTMKMMIKEDCE